MSCLCSAQAAQMHYEETCSSYSFCSSAHEDLLANDTVTDSVAFVGPGEVQTPNHHAVFFDIF